MWAVIIVWLFFVLVCFQAKYVVQFVEFRKRITFSRTLPGPSFRDLLENAKTEKILKWLQELRLKYGSTFRIWFGKDLIVFLTDPEDVKIVLSSNQLLQKSSNYDLLTPWLGRGLLTNAGENWFHRRKLLTPAFHFKILSSFIEPMEDCADVLIDKLVSVADGRTSVDIYPYITLYALDVICETAMGIKKHAQSNSESAYVNATKSLCTILHAQSFSIWQRLPFLFNLSKPGRLRKKYLKILHGETNKVIEIRRKMLADKNINTIEDADKNNDGGTGKIRLAFLDMLLLTQKETGKLTDRQIREEVDTFLFEGHDTTSSAISFTIYLLSNHLTIQNKVYNEIMANESIDQLKYLEAVIKETLRLYPSVPFFSRKVNEPLQIGHMTIPRGTGVSVLSYMVHRNPDIYPNPNQFNPERFFDESEYLTRHPYAFVPFSAGPRNCIGQKFAMLELKSSLSKLIRTFEFLPVENFKPLPVAEIILKSENGLSVKIRKR